MRALNLMSELILWRTRSPMAPAAQLGVTWSKVCLWPELSVFTISIARFLGSA